MIVACCATAYNDLTSLLPGNRTTFEKQSRGFESLLTLHNRFRNLTADFYLDSEANVLPLNYQSQYTIIFRIDLFMFQIIQPHLIEKLSQTQTANYTHILKLTLKLLIEVQLL